MPELLNRVAESDPAEAVRLWFALPRFVTPTLQAAAFADITPQKSARARLASMTDEDLLAVIVESLEASALVNQKVGTKDELLRCFATPVMATVGRESSVDELLL